MKNLRKQILISVLLAASPFYYAFANSPLKDFQIPSQFGTIKEVFESSNSRESFPAIIQIQDAHCNYEAQKNLAQILDYLAKEKKLRLIMVEGGSGDVGLSFLRSFADKSSREEIADRYLRDGKISGEEYLDIVSDLDLELYGIEDPALYDSNLDSFLNIEGYKDAGMKDIASLKEAIEALEPYMYNQALREHENTKNQFDQKSMNLAAYSAYLQEAAGRKGLSRVAYPQFNSFMQSLALEKALDFKQVDAERSAFIKDLANKVGAENVKELIARTQDFKDKKVSAQAYYEYLQEKAKGKIDLATQYPMLERYFGYIAAGKAIDAEAMLKEIVALERAVRETLFVNNDERRLSEISSNTDMLSRFLKLDLTPAEYEAMQADQSRYRTTGWVNFLVDNCRRYGVPARPEVSGIIDDNFEKLDRFYKVGIDREQAFVRNIQQKLEASRDRLVVVITGGFHTTGLSELFKGLGYSYAVVTPAITKKADPEIYFSVLRGDQGELEDTYLAED